jgi:3-oxoadipate enol-lactonase
MDRVALDDVELEYEISGAGEPVVFLHPGIFTDWFTPVLQEPSLAGSYRLVHYHRAGCAGSGRIGGPVSVARQAAHCRHLMQRLGIGRAHVVGHSSSANIVLQLALDSPGTVQSLALLEPALMSVPSAPTSRAFVGVAGQRYDAGEKSAAVDIFLRGTCGQDYRAILDRALPGAFDRYVTDADTFFGQELPALQQWSFGRENGRHLVQPALAVVGARSLERDPIWGERHQLLLDWLPNVEPLVIPDTAHLLEVQNPRAVAAGLAAFFARHPLTVPA